MVTENDLGCPLKFNVGTCSPFSWLYGTNRKAPSPSCIFSYQLKKGRAMNEAEEKRQWVYNFLDAEKYPNRTAAAVGASMSTICNLNSNEQFFTTFSIAIELRAAIFYIIPSASREYTARYLIHLRSTSHSPCSATYFAANQQ